MISKTFRIAQITVLASFALSSAAWATDTATDWAACSNASLSGTYGFLHSGIGPSGTPTTGVSSITFDSTTGTYKGKDIASHNGVIDTGSLTATYAVASNCTVEATATLDGNPPLDLAFVLTSRGFLYVTQTTGVIAQGFGVKQGSPICTNAGVEGRFGFETTGVFLAGAPAIGPVAFIGELELLVNPSNPSGEGMISGELAGTENGTILMFAKEPVTGSYTIGTDCRGRATIKPKWRSAMHFSLLVVDGGKEMLAIETDANTVVSGTLQRSCFAVGNGFQSGLIDNSQTYTSLRPDC
jgi:hypothetical protein